MNLILINFSNLVNIIMVNKVLIDYLVRKIKIKFIIYIVVIITQIF
jgi:hypothetical protein